MEYAKGYWLNEESRTVLSRGYLRPNETAEARISVIGDAAEHILKEMAGRNGKLPSSFDGWSEKFQDYLYRGWYSLASPVWANFGTDRGLPISCNGSHVDDSIESILSKVAEIGTMTKYGSGTSAYLGDLRPRGASISVGGTTDGPVHFAQLFDSTVNIISQSNVRRGACAVYLDATHPDIEEFLEMREEGSNVQKLSLGVCISDEFMNDVINYAGPASDRARRIWSRIIKKRCETGYPYIFFTDTVNKMKPASFEHKHIAFSNLCSEICLPTTSSESFVCCLSSLNLLHYDEWKTTDAAYVLTQFLDAVMEEYIVKTQYLTYMESAHRFARKWRAIGVGVLGWHSYLQSKMIPFEGLESKFLNAEIFEHIQNETERATRDMAFTFGTPEMCESTGVRNATTMAVAPTTSSSFILGQVSPSIEPLASNYFVKDLQKGKFTYRNPYLAALLETKGRNDEKTWQNILMKGGSVQHLDFLTEREKAVFMTFGEISQLEIIQQAAQRQTYIDQGQSLNLMIHPSVEPRDISNLLIEAWRLGVKTLYYQRSTNPSQELVRNVMDCVSCES